MKVILLRDVPKIGKKHEIKDVADGFAHNSLFPRKLATPATAEHIRLAEAERASVAHARDVKEQTLRDIGARSASSPLVIRAAANAQGHLFKGVRAEDIAGAISAAYGITIEPREVVLQNPIKEAGAHAVTLRSGAVEGVCSITITAQS